MGFSADAHGKPQFTDTPTQTIADMQAAADYADRVGGLLKGTAAARGAMTAGQLVVGWIFIETDTRAMYVWTPSGWDPLGVHQHQGRVGSAMDGITVPAAAAAPSSTLLEKSGVLRATTVSTFGNEYMPAVVFDTPFPNAILGVDITPFHINSGPQAPARPFALDLMSPTQFRALVPGSTTATDRAFAWSARGH